VWGRALLGVIYLRLDAPPAAAAALLTALRRAAAAAGGSLVLLDAPAETERAVGRWGDLGGALRVMQAVKDRFDPGGILPPVPGVADAPRTG
jgi:hypothetical protein